MGVLAGLPCTTHGSPARHLDRMVQVVGMFGYPVRLHCLAATWALTTTWLTSSVCA